MIMERCSRFSLNPALDARDLARRFSVHRRIQIADFLEPSCAEDLKSELASSNRWRLVISGGGQVFEIPRRDYDLLPAVERARIEEAIHTAARSGFQFRYEAIRVPDDEDERANADTLLFDFASFMSSVQTVDFIKRITGRDEPSFADAQATRYCAGDLLTRHDDLVAGKNRSLAYILGLTSGWNPDWGGLLYFLKADGDVLETFVPRFNALSLFEVGQHHSVGMVTPFAGEPRVSVTGWFRSKRG